MKNFKTIWFLFFLLVFLKSNGQSLKKSFFKLSGPEKCWVIFHPFKAKRAFRISLEARKISDSIKQTNLLDKDANGGQIDAFRHSYWMATLAQKIGRRSAKSLGRAHEKGNYRQYKKNKLEEGTIPDKKSSEMDLFNNNVGINIYRKNKKVSKKRYIELILDKINQGKLKILKKDNKGRYLDCNGSLLPKYEYYGKWENNKCLIPSIKGRKPPL
jgi:hypothetical protein